MNIKKLGANCSLLETNHGWLILYSYEMAVAGYNPILDVYFKSEEVSSSTTKHIVKWLNGNKAVNMSKNDIENIGFLIGSV